MAIVIRNEGKKINCAINVTPMVDVMLVLLIIFMVITPMLQPGKLVEMASTRNPVAMNDAARADALIVSVLRDGKIFLGNESVTGDALTQKLQERLSSRLNKTVYVRADARVRYGFLVDAIDDVRSAGVDQLGLLTEQKKQNFVPEANKD
jgi:biopolymer transport protein TolR